MSSVTVATHRERPRGEGQTPTSHETSRLDSIREGRLTCGPEVLQVNLGNACNLNCIFCWNHSPLKQPPSQSWQKERLGEEHLANVLRALPRLRPDRVQLSGRGEPLLHPRAGFMLAELQRLEAPVTIQTNGIGGLEPEELVELGVDHLTVNISAGTPEGYERTHPGRGQLFDRVVERLRRIAALRREGRPKVTLVAVIQKTNSDELVPLVELAGAIGASGVHVKGMELDVGLEELLLGPDDSRRVLEQNDRAASLSETLGVEYRAHHLVQVARTRSPTGKFTASLAAGPCYMGWCYLRVTCDGRVMFCCKDKVMGTLSRPLYQIWRSPAYHLQRLAGRDGDLSTGLFDEKCQSCSNFARNREVRAQLR